MKNVLRHGCYLATGLALISGFLVALAPPAAQAAGDCTAVGTTKLFWKEGAGTSARAEERPNYKRIEPGAQDPCVAKARQLAKAQYCPSLDTASEAFDAKFEEFIRALQKASHTKVSFADRDRPSTLTAASVDGIIGPQTWALLATKTGADVSGNCPPASSAGDPGTSAARIELSWEKATSRKGKPAWSEEVIAGFRKNLKDYAAASDFPEVCPRFKSLPENTQLKALGEFWVAVAYRESGYDPSIYSVDVGNKNNRNTWSVGLYQLSVTDGSNIFGYKFEDLQKGPENIKMSQVQLHRQVVKSKKFLLDNSSSNRYWAVILKGNQYSKISEITAQTRKHVPACT